MKRSQALLVVLACATTACDTPFADGSPARVRAVWLNGTDAPLTRTVRVVLSRAAGLEIDYWAADGPRLRVESAGPARIHNLYLPRLRPNRNYEFEVTPASGAARGVPVRASFATEPLPEGLAVLQFEAQGMPTHPLTLIELTLHRGGRTGAIIVDHDGEIVWYHADGPVGGTDRLADGDFIMNYAGVGILRIDAGGAVHASRPQAPEQHDRAHHDAIVTPRNTVLFIALDVREHDGRSIAGEAIWEWDPATGAVQKRWSSWEELSPDVDWGIDSRDADWLHANSLAVGPRGNILMSFRFIHQVISIAPDFSHIEWRLGGVNADVVVSGDDVFVGQHTAAELAPVNGRPRVLLFDNGDHARGYSRALELELDLDAGTARGAWEYRSQPDNFSFITSLARRLENGNTFVAFGAGPGVLHSFGPVEAREVSEAGETLFHLQIGGPTVDDSFVMYRASPLSDIGGERIVSHSQD